MKRSIKINLRLSPDELETLNAAAMSSHQTVSGGNTARMIREAALERARLILAVMGIQSPGGEE